MDIPDSSWGEKCQDKINSFPLRIAANALLQGPGVLRQLVRCAEMARNPKWCWETLKYSEIWIILKVCKLSSVHIFKTSYLSLAIFHACCFLAFTSGKTSPPSLPWTESNLNCISAMRSHPWCWMPLLWCIQQLQSCILFPWVFEHNAKKKT